ncbi:hypothetical protein A3712_24385 [Vibrio sp. HI00D65]|uniref:hypothetical protein n=1 Tax=Vibrio sp. HI00D65 TaxID=1822216 RepID=UPI0007B9DD7E|nr:hypothetical protein [Vibrio sp. HI00D65]KZX56690.1 hypothetical protein A3712_25765 [Vibrio sp. HI00D65]KZX61911.1 hypothetical protein A3712_24385 [Vibrio sp. HI00D65]
MTEKRNIRLSVYLTQSEQRQLADNFKIDLPIADQAKQKQLADNVRNAALGKKLEYKKVNPIAQSQFEQLARLSSNLNQLAHAYNLKNEPSTASVFNLVNEIRLALLNITISHES